MSRSRRPPKHDKCICGRRQVRLDRSRHFGCPLMEMVEDRQQERAKFKNRSKLPAVDEHTPMKATKPKHPQPMQPIVMVKHKDGTRVARFQKNEIVAYLLDHGGIGMSQLAMLPFHREDREQFAQLIGYSVSGAGDLGYFSRKQSAIADAKVEDMIAAEEALRE